MPDKLLADLAEYSGFRYIRTDIVIGEIVEDITVPAVLFVNLQDFTVLMLVCRDDLPKVGRKHNDRIPLGSGLKAADDEHGSSVDGPKAGVQSRMAVRRAQSDTR